MLRLFCWPFTYHWKKRPKRKGTPRDRNTAYSPRKPAAVLPNGILPPHEPIFVICTIDRGIVFFWGKMHEPKKEVREVCHIVASLFFSVFLLGFGWCKQKAVWVIRCGDLPSHTGQKRPAVGICLLDLPLGIATMRPSSLLLTYYYYRHFFRNQVEFNFCVFHPILSPFLYLFCVAIIQMTMLICKNERLMLPSQTHVDAS